jgi:hypothetical protein
MLNIARIALAVYGWALIAVGLVYYFIWNAMFPGPDTGPYVARAVYATILAGFGQMGSGIFYIAVAEVTRVIVRIELNTRK